MLWINNCFKVPELNRLVPKDTKTMNSNDYYYTKYGQSSGRQTEADILINIHGPLYYYTMQYYYNNYAKHHTGCR